jgi:hypothetical protein
MPTHKGSGPHDRDLLFRLAYVRPLVEQLRRQSWCHARQDDLRHATPTCIKLLRCSADQHCKRSDILQPHLFKWRDCRAHCLDQALLLGEVEVGRGANLELLLDQVEDARRGLRQFIDELQLPPSTIRQRVLVPCCFPTSARLIVALMVESSE